MRIKEKCFLIVFIIATLVFFNFPVSAKSLKADIVRVFDENRKLDARIVKEMNFKLAKEQDVGGNTEKYLLEGKDGNKWIFKIYRTPSTVKSSRVVYRLSTFFGIKTPPVYEIELLINTKPEYGSLQKMLQDVKVWKSSFLANISPGQIISFQKQQVLDWLIYNGEVESEEFLLDTKTGEIIPIDRDEVFCTERYEKVKLPGKDPDMFWYNKFFKNLYRNNREIDCTAVFEMIDYIQSTEDKLIKNIFEEIFEKGADYFWRRFLVKKNNLRSDFEKFYQELSFTTEKNILIPPRTVNNSYVKTVLENMKKEILDKNKSLGWIKLNSIKRQENIEVISSKRSWHLIYYNLKYVPEYELLSRAEEINKKLEKLKNETGDVYEKCAINLYINQIEKIKKLYEGKNIDKQEASFKRITIHPLSDKLFDLGYKEVSLSQPQAGNKCKYDKKRLMNELICNFKEIRKLDKQIIKKLRFELCENQYLGGSTQKYLFKSNSGDLWLFKTYSSPKKVKISRTIYLLSQLLGVSTPVVYEISLPVNGKLCYGAIQKFIAGGIQIVKAMIEKLSDEQINEVQNHWVFDWLVFNSDPSPEHFLLEPKTKEIIAIDKDSSLYDMKLIFPDKNPWKKAHYSKFRKAYINNKINIDFEETFNFIDYIQSIEKSELREILLPVLEKDELIDKFFLRRANLKSHFEKLYYELSVLRGEQFQMAGNSNKSLHLISVLEKIKNIVLEKRQLLENLKSQKKTKQSNIIALSSSQTWSMVSKFNGSLRRLFSLNVKKSLDKLEYLESEALNIYEKLAINLYIEEIRRISTERDIENFLQRKIKMISMHPGQITDKKILNREYIFRVTYGKSKKSPEVYKRKLEADSTDVLSHFEYIQYPVRGNDKGGVSILKEYEKWVEKDPENLMYKLFYGIVSNDLNYLKRMEDNLNLKYLGMALIQSFAKDRDEIVKYCNKAIILNKGGYIAYWSYMLLGLLYEYGDGWRRFGEGFELEKSIIAYRNAVMIDPESVKAHLNLGTLYLIKGEADNALNQFKEADELDSKYGKKHFYFDKIKRRDLYENKEAYLEAIKMNTLSGRHHYVLGLAYLVKGNTKKTKQHFNKVKEFGYKIDAKLKKYFKDK